MPLSRVVDWSDPYLRVISLLVCGESISLRWGWDRERVSCYCPSLSLFSYWIFIYLLFCIFSNCFHHPWLFSSLYLWWLLVYDSLLFPLENETWLSGKSKEEKSLREVIKAAEMVGFGKASHLLITCRARWPAGGDTLFSLFCACLNFPQGWLMLGLASPIAPSWGPARLERLSPEAEDRSRFEPRSWLLGLGSEKNTRVQWGFHKAKFIRLNKLYHMCMCFFPKGMWLNFFTKQE